MLRRQEIHFQANYTTLIRENIHSLESQSLHFNQLS